MRHASELAIAAGLTAAVVGAGLAAPNIATSSRDARLVVERGERVMYVAVDKPLYRPGETIWFRSWELAVAGFEPVSAEHAVVFELVDPQGAAVASRRVRSRAGLAANDIALDPAIAGGVYTLRARSELGAEATRRVVVSSYEIPRIQKTVEFLASSYAPGDEVTAAIELSRSTGEPLARARVRGVIQVDGRRVGTVAARTSARGTATLRFTLPARMARGDARLTVIVDDGGATESIQRRIPVVLDEVALELYPEGGDLVAGLPARVYARARDPLGAPVDLRAEIVDDRGRRVAELATDLRGMGRFELTPEPGRRYEARVIEPARLARAVALPQVETEGCALRAADDYRSERPAIELRVRCTSARDVIATAVLREKLLARADARVDRDAAVELPVDPAAQGAVRVTVFDATDHTPLAERLIYRGLGRDLDVTITADRASYGPRDRVTLTIATARRDGTPVPAELALAVVDDAVLDLADDRDSAHILARLYLESEMPGQNIREPRYYFSDDQDAPRALDLLLGTAGWRRFQWTWEPAR